MALIHDFPPFTHYPNSIDANSKGGHSKTQRSSDIISGINDAVDSLLNTIGASHPEGYTLSAGVAILEGEPVVTSEHPFVPGVLDLPKPRYPVIRGDNLKSDFLDQVQSADSLVRDGNQTPPSVASDNPLRCHRRVGLQGFLGPKGVPVGKSGYPDHIVIIKYAPLPAI
ncbi:Myo-inositol-1-phosphate synthase [Marasmius sp. AFHP31]|nr:Myo-inositol-1-phosphate synthase [Marasmius sp. AFHP31]